MSDATEHQHSALGHAGHHPLHAQRAWRDVVDLLAERLPATT